MNRPNLWEPSEYCFQFPKNLSFGNHAVPSAILLQAFTLHTEDISDDFKDIYHILT
jgi:hypothetical protein